MGIYEFNKLTLHDKYDIAFSQAKFVDSVKDKDVRYVLYSFSYFWIEVMYERVKNKVIGISSFVEGESLDRYSNIPKKI